MKYFKILFAALLASIVFMIGCQVVSTDTAAPKVLLTTPAANSVDVAINTNIIATFNEKMSISTITASTFVLKKGLEVVECAVSYSNAIAILNPTVDMDVNSVYTAIITTGVKDLAGNPLAANYEWSFTTGTVADTIAPTVISTVPETDGVDVAIDSNITVTFSEEMLDSSITTATIRLMNGSTPVDCEVNYATNVATLNPNSNLLYSTVYTAEVTTGVTDMSGNALSVLYGWEFVTGALPDTIAPTVLSTVPAADSVNIVVNSNITVTFNEAMLGSSITSSTIMLKIGSTPVDCGVSYLNNVATLNPNANLLNDTVYTVEVTTGVTDTSGNAISALYTWDFTTGEEVDVTAPTVVSTVPAADGVNIAVDSNITVTFSEAMLSSSITGSTIILKNGSTPVGCAVSYLNNVATLNPSSSLLNNTVYTAEVTTGVTDMSGNELAVLYTWDFTTVPDTTKPTVISTTPGANGVNIAIDSNISVTFSEEMLNSTISSSTVRLKNGITPVTCSVSYNDSVVILNPGANLLNNTVYTAEVTTGVTDIAGNALAVLYTWDFTTVAETIAPTVVSTVPATDAVNVAVDSNITVTFSEAMLSSSITTSTVRLKNGTTAVTCAVSNNDSVVTLNPSSSLLNNTVYTAEVTTGVTDIAGNALATLYTWDFTTALETIAPIVDSTVPATDGDNVAVDSNITVTFSEAMLSSSITTSTVRLKNGTTPVTCAVSYLNNVATLNPSSSLLNNTVYTAEVTTGVTDIAGNALAALYTWDFTTATLADTTEPTVVSTVPATDAVNIAVDSNITVTFSEAMLTSSITSSTIRLLDGSTPIACGVSYATNVATLNPDSNLLNNTVYTAEVTTGVTDIAGNALAVLYTWDFTTAVETDPPTVISTIPMNSALDVLNNANISATFSEVMDITTIDDTTFLLTKSGVPVAGVVSYAGTKATFDPTSNLDTEAVYDAKITVGAKDLAGNSLELEYSWSFTTATVVTLGPAPVDLGLAGNFVILAKSAITTTGTTAIDGDIGLFPAAPTFMQGFGLVADASNQFSTSSVIINGGKAYGATYAEPTPTVLNTAVNNMVTAYNDAAVRPIPDETNRGAGEIGGLTLVPGLYKWTTSVLISSDVTLAGGPNDVWIFQISGNLTMASGVSVVLSNGAVPKNIFWQVTEDVNLNSTSHMEGVVMSATAIHLVTGATVNGRLLAQTAVTLDANAVTQPAE